MSWAPRLQRVQEPRNAAALRDVHPLLRQLIDAFNADFVAHLLDVDSSMIMRWTNGAPIISEMTMRILDLHAVFSRAFQVLRPRQAMFWLQGSEPFFDGARPIDVLALRGAAPLLLALNGIDRDEYA